MTEMLSQPGDDSEEKFPRGKILRFFWQNRYGFLKDKVGRDLYFNLDEVRFVGEKDHRDLQEGMEVGYDVGWTSHGLHVTRIKIY
jgi:''Cold-shock'' DNA-binding domain.